MSKYDPEIRINIHLSTLSMVSVIMIGVFSETAKAFMEAHTFAKYAYWGIFSLHCLSGLASRIALGLPKLRKTQNGWYFGDDAHAPKHATEEPKTEEKKE
jgi:hypothetical protein